MGRRGQPGHSHRLVAERLSSGTSMAAAVNDYLVAIGAKGFSPYTVAYRSRSLAQLVAWLAERGVSTPPEVTKPILERYWDVNLIWPHQNDSRWAISSRHSHRSERSTAQSWPDPVRPGPT